MSELRQNPSGLDEATEIFIRVRPRLFGIAYRILGSASDAEDVVQDAWLRWHQCDRKSVRQPDAFLATVTTRLAINVSQSARVRRETYIGPWLPDPIDTTNDPALGAERGDVLDFAVLLLLERLSPTERAAYVLREAFDYPYSRIAEIVRTSAVSARKLVSRARKHIATSSDTSVDPQHRLRLFGAFMAAAQKGDVDALEGLLVNDVVNS